MELFRDRHSETYKSWPQFLNIILKLQGQAKKNPYICLSKEKKVYVREFVGETAKVFQDTEG